MASRRRALLLFGLGILLVLNRVYLSPDGVPVEKTYTYSITRYPTATDRPLPVWALALLRFAGLGAGVGLAFVVAARSARGGG